MHVFPALPSPLRQTLGLRARLFDETLANTLANHSRARHVPIALSATPDMFCADGFHPSPAAYALIAAALADQLQIAGCSRITPRPACNLRLS
jgi:lysophospholipase L1-like esterase